MKKIITIFVVVLASVFSMQSAMTYRGFVDVAGGMGSTCLGFTTTHGVQISSKFFMGVGAGVNYSYDRMYVDYYGEKEYYWHYFRPEIFLCPRLDFPIKNRFRLYLLCTPGMCVCEKVCFSFFGGVGLRYALTSRCGLNFGITSGSVVDGMYKSDASKGHWDDGYTNTFLIGLNVGVDF